MDDGVIDFGINCSAGWGFFLNGIEYSGYDTRRAARDAYSKCKKDMFKLFKKYGCSDSQDEYKKLKRFVKEK